MYDRICKGCGVINGHHDECTVEDDFSYKSFCHQKENALLQEIAMLKEFMTDWANDTYMSGDDGLWYTDNVSEQRRVDKLNILLVICRPKLNSERSETDLNVWLSLFRRQHAIYCGQTSLVDAPHRLENKGA